MSKAYAQSFRGTGFARGPSGGVNQTDLPERPGGGFPAFGEKPNKVENNCTILEDDPVCPLNRNEDPGVWVCRSIIDPRSGEVTDTFSTCASPDFKKETDECGCCGDECRLPCTCPCELDGVAEAGLLVDLVFPFDRDDEDEEDDEEDESFRSNEAKSQTQ